MSTEASKKFFQTSISVGDANGLDWYIVGSLEERYKFYDLHFGLAFQSSIFSFQDFSRDSEYKTSQP